MLKTATITTGQALDAIAHWMARIDTAEWDRIPEAELLELMWRARRLADRMAGLSATITATVERRNAAYSTTGTHLGALIAQREHRDSKDATRSVFQGRDLIRNPRIAQSVVAGDITPEHARGVAKALRELPNGVNREQVDQIAAVLIEEAKETVPSALPGRAAQALAAVAPDLVPDAADANRRLVEQRRVALRRRHFNYGDDGEGSTWFKGSLPHLEAESLIGALSGMVAAAKQAEHKQRQPGRGEVTREQRYADALAQLAGNTKSPACPGRSASATVVVTIAEEHLRTQAYASGVLSSGHSIPAGELRKLLCEANVVPVVLGLDSEILDVGRESRFVTPAIRRVLAIRDSGCIYPGCTVPAMECQAHHVVPWWQGGATEIGNLVLLCPHHHGLVEPSRLNSDRPDSKWQIVFDPRTRKPELARPHDPKVEHLPDPSGLRRLSSARRRE